MAKRKTPTKKSSKSPFEEAVAFLKKNKVEFHQGSEYVGEVGPERHIEPRNYIEKIKIPFTGDEWIDLMSTEGNALGMCCATISDARDILIGQFRGGRWISGEKLWQFVQLLDHHDGFEYMLPRTEKNYEEWKRCEDFQKPKDDPVYRLWEIYDKIKEHLVVSKPSVDPYVEDAPIREPIQAALSLLYSGITGLYWGTSCFDDEERRPAWMKQQKHAARQLTIARLLPALRDVLLHIDKLDMGDFDGFAICKVEEPTAVCDNALGMCIFHTKEEAQKMIDVWAKPEDENVEDLGRRDIRKKTMIRPVHISSKTGLSFKDDAPAPDTTISQSGRPV